MKAHLLRAAKRLMATLIDLEIVTEGLVHVGPSPTRGDAYAVNLTHITGWSIWITVDAHYDSELPYFFVNAHSDKGDSIYQQSTHLMERALFDLGYVVSFATRNKP